MRLLLGEGLVDDALRGRVDTGIGDVVEPMPELSVEIIEIAERSAEEEVLANIAERSFNFTLGLGPVRPAGLGLEAVMSCKVDQAAVVNHETVGILADHRGLHPVVKDLARHPANRVERGNVAAEHGLQVLVNDKTRPDQARMAEDHREQPDDMRDPGLIGELDLKAGEIDLGLLAGRRLEAHLERSDRLRPDLAHGALHGCIAAGVTPVAQLAPQRIVAESFAPVRAECGVDVGAVLRVVKGLS